MFVAVAERRLAHGSGMPGSIGGAMHTLGWKRVSHSCMFEAGALVLADRACAVLMSLARCSTSTRCASVSVSLLTP
jgi:hypothetical protein